MNSEHYLVSNLLTIFYSYCSSGKFFLLASPAWGKTTLIMHLYKSGHFKKIVFISPLTALNLEFQQKLKEEKIPVFDSLNESTIAKGVLVVTPEKMVCRNWENYFEEWADLIVFDEFHLLDMWQNFRPLLIECWYWLSTTKNKVLVLSGTFNWDSWSKSLEGQLWLSHAHNFCKLDLHQKKLLNEPARKYYFPSYMKYAIAIAIKAMILTWPSKRLLLFFPAREQVMRWSRWCRKHGISHLACLGGHALAFKNQLVFNPDPQVIIATSVLSHGVNLPARDVVIILGHQWQEELWIQMKSRGGRRGEKYFLLSEKQVWMN